MATCDRTASDADPDVSVHYTSDETYINSCSPCEYRGNHKQAILYCLDCQELLCQTCKEFHKSCKQFRDHNFTTVASDRRILLECKAVSATTANVRQSTDKRCPQITGCIYLQNGSIVLCDRANNNIKLLNTSYKVTDSLDFPSPTRDAAIVDNKTIVVVLPQHQSLQFVDLAPNLTPGRPILLPKMPLAVDFADDELFVACKTRSKDGTGEIMVLDKQGSLKRQLGIKADGSCMFDCPSHFTVSRLTKNIIVSDRDTSIVTCLSFSGTVLYQFKSPELSRTRGVYLDAVDNMLVCGEESINVLMLTSTGETYGTLLSRKDIPRKPCAITYSEKASTLLIGCYNHDYLLIFKIQ